MLTNRYVSCSNPFMDGTELFRTCRKGHTYRTDDSYAARRGRCSVCQQKARARYRAKPEVRERERKARARLRAKPEVRERERLTAAKLRATAEGREKVRRNNAKRIHAGGMYLGVCAFSVTETEAMLNGSSD